MNHRLIKPLVVASIVICAVVLDQLTKEWALGELSDGHTIGLLPTLEFDLSFNSGFSFGTGQGSGRLIGVGVIALSLVIVRQVILSQDRLRTVLLSIILGGALGNLWDRIFQAESGWLSGHVTDFIDVSWFAVFNVADMFVVCGAIAFGALGFVSNRANDPTLADEPTKQDI